MYLELSDFFTFLGTVPIPVQLGKKELFSLQLEKIAPLDFMKTLGLSNHARLDIRRFGSGIRIHLKVRIASHRIYGQI